MTAAPETLPYRNGVGIMLINAKNLIFVGRRIDTTSDAWQMPQGGIDAGESPREAAFREMKEETGTDKAELIMESRGWYFYDLPADLIPLIWGGRYRGQKQKWFAMRFTGRNADINIATKNPEFCEWKWVQMQELPGLIVPFKRKLYEELVGEFSQII